MIRKILESVRARWRSLRKDAPRRAKCPTRLQMEAVECGAVSLGIVLSHFGHWIPLEELRLACGVSRDGSKASNILKAARSYGLVAKGFKKEPAALRKLPLPAILHWNFNHFLVLEGFGRKGRVYINDPSGGPLAITDQELDDAFTGVVLVMEPGPNFEPEGEEPSLLPALKRRLAGSGQALAFVILAGLALVVPGLVVPVFSKVFVDSILLDANYHWLPPLLIAMILTLLIIGSLTALQLTHLLRLETKMALSQASRFLWHVLRLPAEFFTQRYAGDISSRVTINDRVAQLLSGDLANNALSVILIAFYALIMIQYDIVLTAIGIFVASLNAAALRFVSRRRKDGNFQLVQEKGKLAGAAVGGLQTIETLKATAGESGLFEFLSGYQAKVVNIRQKLERYTQVLEAVPPVLAAINTAVILGVGSLRVIGGSLSLGELVAFQVLMASFILPINTMVALGSKLQLVEGDMNRLDDVLRYPAEIEINTEAEEAPAEEVPDEKPPIKLSGRLELRNITFGYSRLSPPLIKEFNLTLEPASRVALVGGSGSGKSTIARLINALYLPWDGEILFDGMQRHEIPRLVMVNSLASVDQNVALFEGTIRENLTLWDSTIPLPDVIRAAKDAEIHDVIAARPGGYESPVREGGNNFSGGQRQRLEIARALVGNPSLMILDEATSALDPTTENLIDENLRRRGCTCLIVAHRLSTIRDADEIVVLDRGQVAQRGSHDELLEDREGLYAKLIDME